MPSPVSGKQAVLPVILGFLSVPVSFVDFKLVRQKYAENALSRRLWGLIQWFLGNHLRACCPWDIHLGGSMRMDHDHKTIKQETTAFVLNDKLSGVCPASFHVMTEEERSKVPLLEDGQWVGLKSPDLHVLVTVGWKQISPVAMMLSGKSLATYMEKQIRKAMSGFGYKLDRFQERKIAGVSARGILYEYMAQGVEMYAESYVMKLDKAICYFHFYGRTARKGESISAWNEILSSVQIQRRNDHA